MQTEQRLKMGALEQERQEFRAKRSSGFRKTNTAETVVQKSNQVSLEEWVQVVDWDGGQLHK